MIQTPSHLQTYNGNRGDCVIIFAIRARNFSKGSKGNLLNFLFFLPDPTGNNFVS